MSMGELGSLSVPIIVKTDALDRGLAAAHNRLRAANGRFAASMGGVSAATGTAFGGMNRHFSAIQAGLGGVSRSFGVVGMAVGTFAGQIASHLARMATAMAGDVLGGTAIDLERRIGTLAKATDLAGPALAEMKREIYGLSTSMKGVKLDDLIDIATTGAKMGIASEGLIEFTKGIAKASTAVEDMSALDLAESVGKANTVFRLGAGGAGQLSSAFDKLADSGVSSFSGISSVVGRISGVARAAKITAQETAALAAALLDTGSHSELAATSLARLISALNETESHESFANAMGISAEKFAAKVRESPIKAIEEFLVALNKLGAGEQMNVLKGMDIEGVQGAGEIQKLSAQADILSRNIGLANHEFETLEQTNKSYNQTSSQTGSAITQMGNRFRIMADTIGTTLLPVTNAMVGSFSRLATRIEGAFAGNVGRIGGLTAAMIAGGGAIGSAYTSHLDNIKIGLAAVAVRLGEVRARLMEALGPGAIAAISAFGEQAIAAISAFGEQLVASISAAMTQSAVLIRNLPLAFDIAALEIVKHIVGIGAMFEHMGGSIVAVWDYIRETGVAVFTFLGDVISGVFDRVLATIRNSFAMAETAIENILTANVGDIFKGKLNLFEGFDVEKAKAESSLLSMKMPDFKMPEFKMPELDRSTGKIIEDLITDKWATIARAEGRRADAAMQALEALKPGPGLAMPFRKPFDMLAPGSLSPAARKGLGLADPFIGAAAAMGRMALTPKDREGRVRAARAAKLAKRRSREAEKKGTEAARAKLTPAQRKQAAKAAALRADATSQRARRAGVSAKGGAVDILGGIDKTLNSLLGVNKSTDDQLKRGIAARLG